MVLPNKLFSYEESILHSLPIVLRVLKKKPCSVHELYKEVISKMTGVNEFIETLDCLYALGKIIYDDELGELKYVV